MAASACHITTDLTRLSLYDGSTAVQWSPPDTGDAEPTAGAYRQRAQAAAQWLSQQGAAARRLSVVCVDTSEALCTWIQSRSPSYQVVASAYRDQTMDWGIDASNVAVEPILSEIDEAKHAERANQKKKRGEKKPADAATARVSTAVITHHDALVRLWLDALDQRGVRPGAVISLWHALALAWAEQANTTSAVVSITDDHKLIWCWTRNGELLTGGTVAAPRHTVVLDTDDDASEPHDDPDTASEHRLSLDWLSWGAHLGTFPESVRVVSARQTTLDTAIRERFPELRVSVDRQADPLRETLARASAAIASDKHELTSRRCLLRLTRRPTRSVRRRYRLGAAAMILAAAALIGLGVRLQNSSGAMKPVISAYQAEQTALLKRVPNEEINPVLAQTQLQGLINEKRSRPEQDAPPTPDPVYDEIVNLITVASDLEETSISFVRISGGSGSELRVDNLDRRGQLAFETALNDSDTRMSWSRRGSTATNRTLSLSGAWKRGADKP